jgi:hypothetical protein
MFNTLAATGLEGHSAQRFADQQIAFNQASRQLNKMNRQLEEKQKEINALIIKTRDNNIPLTERQKIVRETIEKGTSLTESDFPCPPNFGEFTVKNWGGFGGCGFEIFDKDNNKYWIDINPIYNLIEAVKEGPEADKKQQILNGISEQDRTPEALFTIFPDGYRSLYNGDLKMPKGGAKKKSKKSRKTRKTNKKSKRKNKSSKKNRLLKRKKYTRKHA